MKRKINIQNTVINPCSSTENSESFEFLIEISHFIFPEISLILSRQSARAKNQT